MKISANTHKQCRNSKVATDPPLLWVAQNYICLLYFLMSITVCLSVFNIYIWFLPLYTINLDLEDNGKSTRCVMIILWGLIMWTLFHLRIRIGLSWKNFLRNANSFSWFFFKTSGLTWSCSLCMHILLEHFLTCDWSELNWSYLLKTNP